MPLGEQCTTTTTLDLGFSLSEKDNSSPDLFLNGTNPTDLGISEWLLALQDSDEIASGKQNLLEVNHELCRNPE
jgi:hypothetical protein